MDDRTSYDAFLCHSTRANGALVAELRRELQLRSRSLFGLRKIHLFQDRFDLGAPPALWSTLKKKLGQSRFLVVVLTPESESSPGMDKEIEWWLGNRSLQTLQLVALAGDLAWDAENTCFQAGSSVPTRLQQAYSQEPFLFDLRGYRGAKKRRDDFTDDTLFALLAALTGRSADALKRDDKRRRQFEKLLVVAAAILVLAVLWQTVQLIIERGISDRMKASSEANATAETGKSFLETNPIQAARLIQSAASVSETSRVRAVQGQISLRWPWLSGLWRTIEKPQDAVMSADEQYMLICGGSSYSIVDLAQSGIIKEQGKLSGPDVPSVADPGCRIQIQPDSRHAWLVLEYSNGEDNQRPSFYPGPTVFRFENGVLIEIRKGVPGETPEEIARNSELNGLYFVHDRRLWVCQEGKAKQVSSEGYGLPAFAVLESSDDGEMIAFVEDRDESPEPARADPSDSTGSGELNEGPLSQLVLYTLGSQERKVLPRAATQYDARITLSRDKRWAEVQTYSNSRTVSLSAKIALKGLQRSEKKTEVDAVSLGVGRRDEWVARSLSFSETEVDTSFIERLSDSSRFRFSRFQDREALRLLTPNPHELFVLTIQGYLEHYDLSQRSDRVLSVWTGFPIRRFRSHQVIRNPEGHDAIVMLSPAGGFALFDDSAGGVILGMSRSRVNSHRSDQAESISEALGRKCPDWFASALQRRWDLARTMKVGLHNVKASADLGVAVSIGERTGLRLFVDGEPYPLELPAKPQGLSSDACLQVSEAGDLITIPTDSGTLVYELKPTGAGPVLTRLATLPRATAAAFSHSGSHIALGIDAQIHLYSRAGLLEEATRAGDRVLAPDTRIRAHASHIMRLAFDRHLPLIYAAGADQRVSVHDFETAERYDSNLKFHADRIESLCPLPGGGVLSLDQSRTAFVWRLQPELLHARVQQLGRFPDPN